jgi:hypothetical protein
MNPNFMKKTILLLFCVVATLSSFAQDAVSITHTLPATIAPGQSIDADFTINKGSVGGFAKFQMDLPFGFVATNIDSKGGNFTYENQRVKIVWVSVPSDPSFSFKFKITIPANAVNSCTVSSKFFYLENNVKKEVEMASHNMRIDGAGSVASTTSTPTETVTPTTTTTETVTSNPTTTYTTEPVATNTVTSTPTVTATTETVTSNPTTTYTTEPVATNTVATTPTETVSSTPTETVSTTPTNTTSVSSNTITERTTSTSSDNNNNSNSSSSGMVYKVQLGAFSNQPSKSKFPGVNVSIVQEGGYYKVLSGNFTTMEQAMQHRSAIASKGYDCILVFYQNGQRVGIQK